MEYPQHFMTLIIKHYDVWESIDASRTKVTFDASE
jgi:hypothetical protein